MGLPRKQYVKEGEEGVYHCLSRCVRRAFLCGRDPLTQRDLSHRKSWIVDRLRELAAIFAIEVCAYAVLENHYHTILRTRPDIVASWSDLQVASRWLTLFPHHDGLKDSSEKQIAALAQNPERIVELRKRLSSLSWFMGRLNEFIARAANKEDNVKGRFWESRFKCLDLLDDAALVACMVYVDLNPIRAGLASTPENSDFTSIQERIRAWANETREVEDMADNSATPAVPSPLWLCPVRSTSDRRGILEMAESEYFDLVDRSGRILRSDKRGAVDQDLEPILLRIGANPQAWADTISRFESRFRLAAGFASSLRRFARQLGKRWFSGVAAARIAFAARPLST